MLHRTLQLNVISLAIYIGGLYPAQSADSVRQIRADAAARGRDPRSIKFFVGMSPILGATLEEAQAKYERAKENADVIGGLAVFAGYTGIDLSKHPLDDLLELKGAPGEDAVHSFLLARLHNPSANHLIIVLIASHPSYVISPAILRKRADKPSLLLIAFCRLGCLFFWLHFMTGRGGMDPSTSSF